MRFAAAACALAIVVCVAVFGAVLAQRASAPVSHIIFPRYELGARTEIKPVARAEALGRLMGECLALRQRLNLLNVKEVIDWIAGVDCYTLTFSSLDEATQLVAQVVQGQ